jgi:hypothetical protein
MEDLKYWKNQLRQGSLPMLDLPCDKPRPELQSFVGSSVRLALPASDARRLSTEFRALGVTLFQGLLAAWANLLGHLGNQQEVVVGTPFNARRDDLQGLIGYFINMLAIRVDMIGAESFEDSVQRTSQTVLDAMRHTFLPYIEVLGHLGRRVYDPSRNAVFQTMFAWATDGGGWLHDLDKDPYLGKSVKVLLERDFGTKSAKCDVRVELHQTSHGDICGELEYCTELFSRTTMQQVASFFLMLLRRIPEHPRMGLPTLLGILVRPPSQWSSILRSSSADGCVSTATLPFADSSEHRMADWQKVDSIEDDLHENEIESVAFAAVCVGIVLCKLSRCKSALLAVSLPDGSAAGRVCPVQVHCSPSSGFRDLVSLCVSQLSALASYLQKDRESVTSDDYDESEKADVASDEASARDWESLVEHPSADEHLWVLVGRGRDCFGRKDVGTRQLKYVLVKRG